MGNTRSLDSYPATALQRALEEDRTKATQDLSPNTNGLPRSTFIEGRFHLLKEHFPDYIEYRSFQDIRRWRSNAGATPTYSEEFLNEHLPVLPPNKALLESGAEKGHVQATWIGHASVLTQWEGWNVLADPIFSERCSPFSFAGPARLRPSPVHGKDLPQLDVIVISHNHYDHLDTQTVVDISATHPHVMWFVPLKMKQWFLGKNVSLVCFSFLSFQHLFE